MCVFIIIIIILPKATAFLAITENLALRCMYYYICALPLFFLVVVVCSWVLSFLFLQVNLTFFEEEEEEESRRRSFFPFVGVAETLLFSPRKMQKIEVPANVPFLCLFCRRTKKIRKKRQQKKKKGGKENRRKSSRRKRK